MGGAPARCIASHSTAAVMPLPHVPTTGLSPRLTASHRSGPSALARTRSSSDGGSSVWYAGVVDDLGDRTDEKGSERAWGMWPDERPSRGSGSVPWKLRVRAAHAR